MATAVDPDEFVQGKWRGTTGIDSQTKFARGSKDTDTNCSEQVVGIGLEKGIEIRKQKNSKGIRRT
jgi:hypothetical protein